MACQRKRPHHCPGCCNQPRAPNLPDEAIPSHPLPTMGGPSTPTTNTKSARANDRDPRLPKSSASPPPMTLPFPSLQPFSIEGGNSTYSRGGFTDSFRDKGVLLPSRKCQQGKHQSCRVCRRHGPQAQICRTDANISLGVMIICGS